MPSSREIIDEILEWTKKALVLGQNVNSVVPIPAYGPISTVLVALIDQIAAAQTNQRAAAAVLQQIQTLAKIVGQSKDTLDSGITSLSAIDLEKIQSEIQDQTSKFKGPFDKFLEDLQQLNALSAGLKHKYGWLRLVFVVNDAEIIRQIQEGVSNATVFFETRCHVETQQYLRVIQDKVAEIHSTVKNTEGVVNTQADRDILESLPHIDASYRASTNAEKGKFLAGTRSRLFDELEKWIKGGSSKKPVCILSGGAGTGKSTVASELARQLDGKGKLGASFFFSRGITDLDSTRVFFPTIAYQLANWNNGTLRQPIVDAARKHLGKGTVSQAMKYQASDLLHASLDNADKASPIYVVVDALDECTQDASKLVPEMLDLLMTATQHGRPLRIFLTSRPDPLIEYNLQYPQWANIIHTISIDTSSSHVSRDVAKFVDVRLRKIAYGPELLGRRPDVAGHLARRAQGLFIYARTAVNFLGTYPGTLDEGVDYLLQGESEGVALSALDGLYLTVLTNAFPPDSLLKNPRLRERVQFFLACIALQEEPMTPQFLQSLTSPTHAPVTCKDGDSVLDRLRAVIIFERDAPNKTFRPIHATFPQFLVDKTRCTNELYLVDPRQYYARMAEACLRTVLTLDKNMCKLEPLEPLEPLERVPREQTQLVISWMEMDILLQRMERLKSLERLQPLERLERRQRLEQLQPLESLERRKWLERLALQRLEQKRSELQARFPDSFSHSAGGSSTPDFPIAEFTNLEERFISPVTNSKLKEMLLPEPLPKHVLYACKYWASHLQEACKPDEHQDEACSCRKLVEPLQRFVRDWDNLRRVEIINLMTSEKTHSRLEADLNHALNWLPSDRQYDTLRSELQVTAAAGFRASGFEGLDLPEYLQASFAVAAKRNRTPGANA